jgi:WD40 repeat protein
VSGILNPGKSACLFSSIISLIYNRTLLASWRAQFGGGAKFGPVLNRILLHPSGNAIVTAGTRGPIRLWDITIDSYSHLRSINPFENVVMAAAFHDDFLVLGGSMDSVENACGLPAPIIYWDLSHLRVNGASGHAEENYKELAKPPGSPRDVKVVGSNLFVTFLRDANVIVVQEWKRM